MIAVKTTHQGTRSFHVHSSAEWGAFVCTDCGFDFCRICEHPRFIYTGAQETECGHPVAPAPRYYGPKLSCFADDGTPYQSVCGTQTREGRPLTNTADPAWTSAYGYKHRRREVCRVEHMTQEEAVACYEARAKNKSEFDYTRALVWKREHTREGGWVTDKYGNDHRVDSFVNG